MGFHQIQVHAEHFRDVHLRYLGKELKFEKTALRLPSFQTHCFIT